MNIDDRYKRLLQRRAPEEDRLVEKFSEGYEKQSGTAVAFLLGALKGVDEKYTKRLIGEGNRVEKQLEGGSGSHIQGLNLSVKARSQITPTFAIQAMWTYWS